jgi:hypothetical protein
MTAHRSRRWFQLSLKSLFLLTLLVATFFAGYSLAIRHGEDAMRVEREARARAEKAARQAEVQRQAERDRNALDVSFSLSVRRATTCDEDI